MPGREYIENVSGPADINNEWSENDEAVIDMIEQTIMAETDPKALTHLAIIKEPEFSATAGRTELFFSTVRKYKNFAQNSMRTTKALPAPGGEELPLNTPAVHAGNAEVTTSCGSSPSFLYAVITTLNSVHKKTWIPMRPLSMYC